MGAVSVGRLRRKLEVNARSEFVTAPATVLLLLFMPILLRFPTLTLLCERLRDRGCVVAEVAVATVAVAVAAATNGGAVVAAAAAVATRTALLLASNRVDT